MITPFKLFIKNNFPFIENTYEALDNYGLLCKIVEKLNEVIGSENEVVNKLDNFIETLDITEEISNKLDEMAEDGTLAEIINSQIFGSLNERVMNNEGNIANLTNNVGSLANLNTDTKQSIVSAINEVYFKLNYNLGNLQDLETETKLDVVAAINEVLQETVNIREEAADKIGDLSLLTTENKNSLVNAVNEVNEEIGNLNEDIYSTVEHKIGTFLGKPLYRKCIDIPTSRFAEGQEYVTGGYQIGLSSFGITDVDLIAPRSTVYLILNTNPRQFKTIPTTSFEYPQQGTSAVTFSTSAITINAGTSIVSNLRSATKVYGIIEYTKTTD